jgi:nucleoside-diphosphate-sugar epimerase
VAAAVALAVVDERAAGRFYNVGEPVALTEVEWVRRIGEVVGWRGEVVTLGAGRISVPVCTEQGLGTDSTRIRRELGFAEVVTPREGLERTIAWERTDPAGSPPGIGLLDYEAENAILAEAGHT